MDQHNRVISAIADSVGIISFLSVLGLIIGIIAITWGLAARRKRWKLTVGFGCAGILVSVMFLVGLFFYSSYLLSGETFEKLRADMARNNLRETVKSVEYFKVARGKYPASLDELKDPKDQFAGLFIVDPLAGPQARNLFYQLSEDGGYFLLSVGPDGKPFTTDDLLPEVAGKELGLRVKK